MPSRANRSTVESPRIGDLKNQCLSPLHTWTQSSRTSDLITQLTLFRNFISDLEVKSLDFSSSLLFCAYWLCSWPRDWQESTVILYQFPACQESHEQELFPLEFCGLKGGGYRGGARAGALGQWCGMQWHRFNLMPTGLAAGLIGWD